MPADIFQSALLDVIVPDDSLTDLAILLEADGEHIEGSSRLLDIKEREMLFFDERLRALAVLQLPHCEEHVLKSHISRLSCKIDVWVVDDSGSVDHTPGGVPSTTPTRDVVCTVEGFQKDEPIVLASESQNGARTLTLVWEVDLNISRPRFRLPQPAVVFIPTGTLTSSQSDGAGAVPDLAPFEPMDSNVLEPMRFMPGFETEPPYLAASRLVRVVPGPVVHKQKVHIQHVPSRPKRAILPMIARVRYQRISSHSSLPANIAMLDMEVVPFVEIDVSIQDVDLSLKNGSAESLMPDALPMPCRSGDTLTFMYKLHQSLDPSYAPATGLSNPNIDVLSVRILFQIVMSGKCQPVVTMEWTTHVDFTQALNPSFGPPSQPIQRPNRPMSLSVGNGTGVKSTLPQITTSLQPALQASLNDSVSISFTATSEPVQVGKPFVWKVLVVNHSHRAAKLTIIPLPRVPRHATAANIFARRHAPKTSNASFHRKDRRHSKEENDVDIAQAIIDENVVYAMHHSNIVPAETDLMAVTAELRIGPLGTGQCHESDIEMIAFDTGALRVDAIRVVDLVKEAEEGTAAPGFVTDIRDLPDIIVIRPEVDSS